MKIKNRGRIQGVFLLFLIFYFISGEIAFAQSSTNYEMQKYVMDMCGAGNTSTQYYLVDVGGQPTPPGEIFSTNYTLSAGFLGQVITFEFRGTKLTASDGDSSDVFGRAVALGDRYAVIGASDDDNGRGKDAGAVYIFTRSGENWIEQIKILTKDGAEGDYFGYAVAADGDYVVVGTPWDDDKGDQSGSAYILKRDGTSWTQQAKLIPSDGGADNRFGIAVDISGDYVLIGAFFDNDFGTRSGSAYIFKRNGTIWSEQAVLKANDGAEGDWFGVSVSIDGDYAVVGSRYDDNEKGIDAGAAYLFKRDGSIWTQKQKLMASDGAANDLFHEVDLLGNHLVVGAYQDDDKGDNSGSIYVFANSGTSWIEQEKLTASDGEKGENFGCDISMNGKRMVVGAYRDDANGANSGSIYVFEYNDVRWNEIEKIIAYDGDAGDYYGLPVEIKGDYILVAARNDDDKGTNAGAAFVYASKSTAVSFDFAKVAEATVFQISPAYPNPFNPGTTIRYALPGAAEVNIGIYNMLGQRIRTLENSYREPGSYSVHWDGKDEIGNSLTSGVYLCQIQAGAYRQSIKLAILK
jgi:hypothetical protein